MLAIIQFSQNLMQYGWVLADPFLQFPQLSPEDAAKLQEALPPGTTIYQYAVMDKTERKAVLDKTLSWTPGQYDEHLATIDALPLVQVTLTADVPGEKTVAIGDVLKCKLRVEFLNLKDGEQSGYVHSRTYPYLRRDSWFLIITEASMTGIAAVEKLPIEKNVYEKEFSEKIARAGPIEFVCILANDSYKGLDQVVQCRVDVVEADPLRVEYQYDQEDLDLCKEAKKEEEVAETADDSDPDAPEEEDLKDEL